MNPTIEELIKIANEESNGQAKANMFNAIAKIYAVDAIVESFKNTDARDHGWMAIGKVFSEKDEDLERALQRVLSIAEDMLRRNQEH